MPYVMWERANTQSRVSLQHWPLPIFILKPTLTQVRFIYSFFQLQVFLCVYYFSTITFRQLFGLPDIIPSGDHNASSLNTVCNFSYHCFLLAQFLQWGSLNGAWVELYAVSNGHWRSPPVNVDSNVKSSQSLEQRSAPIHWESVNVSCNIL